jgi:rubredoxin
MQDLIGLRKPPSRGAGGRDFHRALEFHDADFVCGPVADSGLRTAIPDPGHKNCPDHNQQDFPDSFRTRVQQALKIDFLPILYNYAFS